MMKLPKKIRKRDGSIVSFSPEKIERAILKAALGTIKDKNRAAAIAPDTAKRVLEKLSSTLGKKIPSIENMPLEAPSSMKRDSIHQRSYARSASHFQNSKHAPEGTIKHEKETASISVHLRPATKRSGAGICVPFSKQ